VRPSGRCAARGGAWSAPGAAPKQFKPPSQAAAAAGRRPAQADGAPTAGGSARGRKRLRWVGAPHAPLWGLVAERGGGAHNTIGRGGECDRIKDRRRRGRPAAAALLSRRTRAGTAHALP